MKIWQLKNPKFTFKPFFLIENPCVLFLYKDPYQCFPLAILCYSQTHNDPQEYLPKFGYKLNTKVNK